MDFVRVFSLMRIMAVDCNLLLVIILGWDSIFVRLYLLLVVIFKRINFVIRASFLLVVIRSVCFVDCFEFLFLCLKLMSRKELRLVSF